jgi:MerR family mercuric resistance operon transcriptional regulator
MTSEARSSSRGELSKKTGVNGETIRYYEKIGLVPEPDRAANGYRVYGVDHLKSLSFIKRCRELGFTLKEIAALLALVDGGSYTCEEIRDQTITHLNDINNKIRDLKKMQRTLREMVSKCEGGLLPECPIVDTLFNS